MAIIFLLQNLIFIFHTQKSMNYRLEIKIIAYLCTRIIMMQTYCSIALEITTQRKESKQHIRKSRAF